LKEEVAHLKEEAGALKNDIEALKAENEEFKATLGVAMVEKSVWKEKFSAIMAIVQSVEDINMITDQ